MSSFNSLLIADIVKETPSAVSIVFNIPEDKKDDYQFIPGQFITLKATIDGEEVRRAYSISSATNAQQLQVSVKKIAGGQFSTYANEVLQAGDYLEVMVPEGKFQLPAKDQNKNFMAFAAGSGITPIMSMIKTTLQADYSSKFVLLYGNKRPEETMFLKELLELQSVHPERLFLEFTYSQEDVKGSNYGRIEKSLVEQLVKNQFSDFKFDTYYICGPEAMIHTTKDTLKEIGINADQIKFELFTSSSSTSTVENINSGAAKIKITVDDEEFEISSEKNITLLEAALREDIDAPYSCKGGVCCSCICRVTEGEVEMPENNLLTEDEIAEGLTLACKSYPKSDKISIDFDDA